ncbi:DNA primase [Microbulbifer hydrolyticus]|uniref:DNA primase n=1 Tax=Microbulbifer hydrolyticus TaxID=48074 RepID=A0A6P1TC58_9GAMM|nr:DNA primase [Microbulbifer hydrolyticus]MBB5212992.1 DNA primase [Microbulbifer hydrolyticus]QHQ40358.1 DNA primase [Microbulbifer hydrolyticus]
MAGKIPQYFIDDLLARADIVPVVDSRVKLRKTGKNYSACCPFHDEKTPSFTVSPDKQFYYCFGCGASGNAVGFLMEYDRLPFPEAVEKLAASLSLEVPREQLAPGQIKRQQESQSLYQLTEKAADFYREKLRDHKLAARAITYLKNRGLSGAVAKEFGIGLAPPGWDNLLNHLGTSAEKAEQLELAGLAIRRQDSDGNPSKTEPGKRHHYDRFRNRIMFPIRDQRGRTIAFGGRVLGDDKPKYLNSPETPIFHKGRELYGLWEARQANRELKRLIVVEGYMDVVALAQYGIRCAVATLGTACGEDHIQLAFRHTGELVFCFDGDQAGRTAARRALEAALPHMQDGRSLRFLLLPEGEDPDTLVRQIGGERFDQLIDEQGRPLEDFLFDLLGEGINIQTMDGRARLSKAAAPLLDLLPAGVYRQLMFQQLARRTGLEQDMLEEIIAAEKVRTAKLAQQTQAAPGPAPQKTQARTAAQPTPEDGRQQPAAEYPGDTTESAPPGYDEPPPDYDYVDLPPHGEEDAPSQEPSRRRSGQYRLPAERMLIALLLHHPQLARLIADHGPYRGSNDADLQLFGEILQVLHKNPDLNSNQLFGRLLNLESKEARELLPQLAMSHPIVGAAGPNMEYDPETEFHDCLRTLEQAAERQRKRGLVDQLKNNGNQLSPEQLALLAQFRRKQD